MSMFPWLRIPVCDEESVAADMKKSPGITFMHRKNLLENWSNYPGLFPVWALDLKQYVKTVSSTTPSSEYLTDNPLLRVIHFTVYH